MADREKPAVGQVEEMRLRRIGVDHAVVMAPREAKIISLAQLRRNVAEADRRLEQLTAQRSKLEAYRSDQAGLITQLASAKIDRIKEDPEVPQERAAPAPVGALRGG